jgi:hypothetical protein
VVSSSAKTDVAVACGAHVVLCTDGDWLTEVRNLTDDLGVRGDPA